MDTKTDKQIASFKQKLITRKRNSILFFCVAFLFFMLDFLSKNYFNQVNLIGNVISEPFFGIFRFHLVHNTGAAWGIFDESTMLLGLLSIVVCIIIIFFFLIFSEKFNAGQSIGLGMILAGGIGNGINRLTLGYVVDFIDFTFIDFPVFNIADIGVTCGIALFAISMILAWIKEERVRTEAEELKAAATGTTTEMKDSHSSLILENQKEKQH